MNVLLWQLLAQYPAKTHAIHMLTVVLLGGEDCWFALHDALIEEGWTL